MFRVRALILKAVETWRSRLFAPPRPPTLPPVESSATSTPTLLLPAPSPTTTSTTTTQTPTSSSTPGAGSEKSQPPPPDEISQPQGPARPQQASGRKPRSGFPLGFSPIQAICRFLRHRETSHILRRYQRGHRQMLALAKDRSDRPTVLLAQAVLRRLVKTGAINRKWADDLETWDQFDARIENLSRRNITPELLSHWSWILTTKDRDLRVRRFVLSPHIKPFFLLDFILRVDDRDLSKESLVLLVDHLSKRRNEMTGNICMITSRFDIDSVLFASTVLHLVKRCLAIWPPLLPTLAHLTAEYIKGIPLEPSKDPNATTHGFKCRCQIFNKVVQTLGEKPRRGRRKARELCWEAQKILLECSSTSEPQLIISRLSYRSIRTVLLGLKKTPMETRVALRSSSTWPPYREVWDGIDERRKPEDDLSKASRAGILMHEAGYGSTYADEALTALGGSFTGRQPTVQTHTLDFDLRDHPNTLWVARMIATRNAREAWRVFQSPPIPDMLPTTQVYAIMFAKLYALPAVVPGQIPGDTTRVFPVDNTNLSPYSISILDPPDPKSLYLAMLKQRLAPTGQCLKLLIQNSASIREAFGYIMDSPYWDKAQVLSLSFRRTLHPLLESMNWSDLSRRKIRRMRAQLHALPAGVVVAWIDALCRHDTVQHFRKRGICLTKNAFFLAKLYHAGLSGSKKAEPMFLRIAKSLSRGSQVPSASGPRYNGIASLQFFLYTFSEFKSVERKADETMFKYFCGTLRNSLWTVVFHRNSDGSGMLVRKPHNIRTLLKHYAALLLDCRRGIVLEFDRVVQPPDSETVACEGVLRQRHFPIDDVYTLTAYVRALVVSGNSEDMVRLVNWLFDSYERGDVFPADMITIGSHQYNVLMGVLAYFDTAIGMMITDTGVRQRLRDRLEFLQKEKNCPWHFHELHDVRSRGVLRYDIGCGRILNKLTSGWKIPSTVQNNYTPIRHGQSESSSTRKDPSRIRRVYSSPRRVSRTDQYGRSRSITRWGRSGRIINSDFRTSMSGA